MTKIHIIRNKTHLYCGKRNQNKYSKACLDHIVDIHHVKMWCKQCLDRSGIRVVK